MELRDLSMEWDAKVWEQSIGSSTVQALERKIHILEKFYIFGEPMVVTGFLMGNPFLVDLLFEAHSKIRKHFGPQANTCLEVVADPETEDSQKLVAYVQTPLNAPDAINRLHELDEEWFLDAKDQVGEVFLIHVEF